jgi:hypothetical protein
MCFTQNLISRVLSFDFHLQNNIILQSQMSPVEDFVFDVAYFEENYWEIDFPVLVFLFYVLDTFHSPFVVLS